MTSLQKPYVKTYLDQALDALRNRYVNPDRIELYKL